MTYECIEVRTEADKVGIIQLNRPKQLNALNDALMDELGLALVAGLAACSDDRDTGGVAARTACGSRVRWEDGTVESVFAWGACKAEGGYLA